MSNEEYSDDDLNDELSDFVGSLVKDISSPAKRWYATQVLLNDFNNTLPRGIYMSNEFVEEDIPASE